MTTYQSALAHAKRMLGALTIAILLVLVIDQFFGHSTIAFAIAIIGLVAANRPMLRMNCTTCGKNLFFRGIFVVPWPNKVCGKCGTDLAEASD
ncbi:hypothetical protein [Erythrobacter crassostreae]|uniref:Uncharacterized protein n=1 Tax=Erythrobacter crassostreae TaxID=2828328 RepID=A0A9X1F4I8_9SPHN|nr:hypothetical protein [Erythrobacter crassostrea]MBV7260116.1 hypothetical protein [Erythrobacter crassostrea]